MKQQYIAQANTIMPVVIPEGLLIDEIEPAIYTVKASQQGFYLERTKDSFDDQPTKLYGSTIDRAKRIKHVYEQSDSSTGVLFTGLKGAGKSLLMKEVANNMLAEGMPVVIVQNNFHGPEFMTFMNQIGECVVLLDEFGKTYSKENNDGVNEQDSLLTFFDGVYSSKRLILLAENSTWDISDLFLDRPSRVMFHWKYDRLEQEVIEGYCEDNLDNPNLLPDVLNIYTQSKDFTFDSLKALVWQCNLFPEVEFQEIVDGLNIPIPMAQDMKIISVKQDGKDIGKRLDGQPHVYHNGEFRVNWFMKRTGKHKEEFKGQPYSPRVDRRDSCHFSKSDFVSQIDDVITYVNQDYNLELQVQVTPKTYSSAAA